MHSVPPSYPKGVDERVIQNALQQAKAPEPAKVRAVLEKAKEKQGLSPEETATLLANTDAECREELLETARTLKHAIYGSRLVLFAPLYITNECANRCTYCGFQEANTALERRTLDDAAIAAEVRCLERQGHKRLLLVYGEHPLLMRTSSADVFADREGAEWIARTVRTVYDTAAEKSGTIRRANINCAPLSVEGFRRLKDAGIGTYQCFQETYHRPTYASVHRKGPKADYTWRYQVMHRAMEAGIDDVGMGILFGLYSPAYELLALMQHAGQLEQDFGVGPHTVSFPRIEPAHGAALSRQPPYPIADDTFISLVAILRLALPYTGLILTTREQPDLRRQLIEVGVSQLSAASRTSPGGYTEAAQHDSPATSQFDVGDHRSLDEIVHAVVTEHGCLPSWCTACYRAGRTGDHFMDLAKTGFIQRFCHPNSLLTFKEYLLDYASPATRLEGEKLLRQELETLSPELRSNIMHLLEQIEAGARDVFL